MRPKVKSSQRTEMSDAVRELRTVLGMTQQAFATELGTAITTIARYETNDRIPRARALVKLAQLAQANNQVELAAFFRRALAIEFREVSRKGYELVITAPHRRALGLRELTTEDLANMKRLLRTMWQISTIFNSDDLQLGNAIQAGKAIHGCTREFAVLLLEKGEQALHDDSLPPPEQIVRERSRNDE